MVKITVWLALWLKAQHDRVIASVPGYGTEVTRSQANAIVAVTVVAGIILAAYLVLKL